jgi:hypothetical protein
MPPLLPLLPPVTFEQQRRAPKLCAVSSDEGGSSGIGIGIGSGICSGIGSGSGGGGGGGGGGGQTIFRSNICISYRFQVDFSRFPLYNVPLEPVA